MEGYLQPSGDIGNGRKRNWCVLIHILNVAALMMVSSTIVCLPVIVMGIIRSHAQITGNGPVLGCTLISIAVTVLVTQSHENPREDAESQKQLGEIRHGRYIEPKNIFRNQKIISRNSTVHERS